MKNSAGSLILYPNLAIGFLIRVIFPITAVVTHLWTVYIGFTEGGFFGGILTLVLPVLSELYWVYQMWGINELYAWVGLVHIILAIPAMFISREKNF